MTWAELTEKSDDCASRGVEEGREAYDGWLGLTKDILVEGIKADGSDGVVKAKLIGLNHDEFSEGGTAGFTFQLTDGLSATKPVKFQMNTSGNSSGGWEASDMRKLLARDGTFWQALQKETDNPTPFIKDVKKMTSTSYKTSSSVSQTDDTLWLLSLVESIGTKKTAYTDNPVDGTNYLSNEGSQYEYYAQFKDEISAFNAHKIKDYSGSGYDWWWLRSIYVDMNYFYYMKPSGGWRYDWADRSRFPAAGFCL